MRRARAERAGAVNTLVLEDTGNHYGDNTDGAGLVRDLCDNHGVTLQHARLLLLGAGGAKRGKGAGVFLDEDAVAVAQRDVELGGERREEAASCDVDRKCVLCVGPAGGEDALPVERVHPARALPLELLLPPGPGPPPPR